ncbi:MAG: PQQ-binding-like beta-propeller repeat protein, partial [Pirellulales bacterium]|nr:PQQ-binding-like beta-propeller repeat protein [Pirellulales bacterium]
LACFDLDGNLRWLRGLAYDYPRARIDAGMSSSPLVVGPTVIVQLQNQGESFVSGIDTATGKTRWRIPREREAIWSSPTVLRGESPSYEDDLVLLQDRENLTAHDPQTGKEVCKYKAQCHTISSVTTGSPDGKSKGPMNVYLPALGLHALRANPQTGGFEFLWHERRMSSNNTSPVIHNGRAYTIKSSGVLACGDAASGKVLWQLRLKGPFWATPLVNDTHLYAVNYDGAVHVVELGEKEGKLLRTCQFDSKILASPVAVDGAIYLRSDQHLMKVVLPK